MSKKKTTEEFIEEIKKLLPDSDLDFSETVYVNKRTKVKLICPIHGEFEKLPTNILKGQGCPKCGWNRINDSRRVTTEEFIDRSKQVHGNRYNYDKTIFIDFKENVIITCPIHGDFSQLPSNHLSGSGCPECSYLDRCTTKGEFIIKANKIHNNKYNYPDLPDYVTGNSVISVVCPEHGEFKQNVGSHLNGHGCYECGRQRTIDGTKLTQEEFIRRAKEIHGDQYDYSKINYVNNSTKVTIICPEHGEFQQTPDNHISQGQGCPVCRQSHLERIIRNFFIKENLEFTQYMKFDWLGLQSLDFYIPSLNIGIECQGLQHYIPKDHFHGLPGYIHRRYLDMKKQRLCREHGVTLLYFTLPELAHFDPSAYVTTRSLLARLRQ